MKISLSLIFAIALSLFVSKATAQDMIQSGIHWYDQDGNEVSAHGAGIIKDNSKYYLIGEFKSDTSNAFVGFSCYSSKDLAQWKFENVVLKVQQEGRLGPQRVGERPKVMKCPSTGEYVMYMHTDNMKYKDQCVGYATCNKIDGDYEFQGPLLYDGKPIRKWDMGVFQDDDGKGYLITHSGNLYELSTDYKSITCQVVKGMTSKCESPVIFKKDNLYYWIGSGLTGWERNDNYYFTASSLEGPWTSRGLIAPKGKLTWNSQSTFVLPIIGSKDTTYMYMGDRWSHPKQRSAATYVWQPLEVNGNSLSMPEYYQRWSIDTKTGKWNLREIDGEEIDNNHPQIKYIGEWQHGTSDDDVFDSRSNQKDARMIYTFTGKQIALISKARPNAGYAKIELENEKGEIVLSNLVDMYCLYPETSIKFQSPVLKKGTYTLTVTVVGEHWFWYLKSGKHTGSTDDFISIDKLIIAK